MFSVDVTQRVSILCWKFYISKTSRSDGFIQKKHAIAAKQARSVMRFVSQLQSCDNVSQIDVLNVW